MKQLNHNSLKGAFVALMTIYSAITFAETPVKNPVPPVKVQEELTLMSFTSTSLTANTSLVKVSAVHNLNTSTITIPSSRTTVTVTVEAEDGTVVDILTYKAGASKQVTLDTTGWDSGTYTVIISNKHGIIDDTFIFVF